jgi:hypothetical protein
MKKGAKKEAIGSNREQKERQCLSDESDVLAGSNKDENYQAKTLCPLTGFGIESHTDVNRLIASSRVNLVYALAL